MWDSEKKDFLGILTLRDLLEMLVFFADALKESFQREEVAAMNEKTFLCYFLERYLMISNPLLSGTLTNQSLKMTNFRLKSLKRVDSSVALRSSDLSILPKILESVALFEWFAVSREIVKFHKS